MGGGEGVGRHVLDPDGPAARTASVGCLEAGALLELALEAALCEGSVGVCEGSFRRTLLPPGELGAGVGEDGADEVLTPAALALDLEEGAAVLCTGVAGDEGHTQGAHARVLGVELDPNVLDRELVEDADGGLPGDPVVDAALRLLNVAHL